MDNGEKLDLDRLINPEHQQKANQFVEKVNNIEQEDADKYGLPLNVAEQEIQAENAMEKNLEKDFEKDGMRDIFSEMGISPEIAERLYLGAQQYVDEQSADKTWVYVFYTSPDNNDLFTLVQLTDKLAEELGGKREKDAPPQSMDEEGRLNHMAVYTFTDPDR